MFDDLPSSAAVDHDSFLPGWSYYHEMARRRGLDATAGLRSLLCLSYLLHLASAFQFVPDSPCEPVCQDGNLSEDAVCLDDSYRNTENGTRIQECVGCLLNSTAVDTASNQTDVEWGLCRSLAPTMPSVC